MLDLKELLIPTVNAQSDTFVQPTFGPISGGSGGTTTGSIFLSVDKTDIDIGETFTLTVSVNSNDIPINAIQIVVDFDPSLLTAIDADSSIIGTQAEIVDPVFAVNEPELNNTVSQNGRMTVLLTSSSAVTVDGDIVQIQMQSQASGSAVISVNESLEGSVLQQSDGSTLAFTTNQNTVDISTTVFGEEPDEVDSSPVSLPTSTPTDGGGVETPLPDTALPQDIAELMPLFAGLALLVVGFSLIRGQKGKGEEPAWS